MPRMLVGKASQYKGAPLCFDFNLPRGCSAAAPGNICGNGYHVCCEPGCFQNHSWYEYHAGACDASAPRGSEDHDTVSQVCNNAAYKDEDWHEDEAYNEMASSDECEEDDAVNSFPKPRGSVISVSKRSRGPRMPRMLVGKASQYKGAPLCFDFNLPRGCSAAAPGNICGNGHHVCCEPGCFQNHSWYEYHGGACDASAPHSSEDHDTMSQVCDDAAYEDEL